MKLMNICDVAIIGAGPYGLSIAAHLKALGVNFRIFGTPMHTWRTHMPKGMRLKSEGFASTLYDPGSTFTLEVYCKERGIPYRDLSLPVPLEVFTAYGLEFQKRFVPELETKLVESLKWTGEGFQIRIEGGNTLSARRVVIAVGLTYYKLLPPELSVLPESHVTHSSQHSTVDQFRGREVAVVGAGASALDVAALLCEAGAKVQVLARKPVIRFHDPPEKQHPSFLDQLRNPITGIGPGWKLYFYANAPLIFRQMPLKFRLDRVKRILGPAPCWFIKDQVVGKVSLIVDVKIIEAKVLNGRVSLRLKDSAGTMKTLAADHVISATGYKVDLRRLAFMDSGLQSAIRSVENTPVLSSNFESAVPGLYFVGATAANTFGPLLRFAFGAGFTAKRLSKHLAKTAAPGYFPTESTVSTEISEPDGVAVR
jgi:thioredoxin reductase